MNSVIITLQEHLDRPFPLEFKGADFSVHSD